MSQQRISKKINFLQKKQFFKFKYLKIDFLNFLEKYICSSRILCLHVYQISGWYSYGIILKKITLWPMYQIMGHCSCQINKKMMILKA